MAKEEETFNRLFILGGKGCSEEDVRGKFEQFGDVKNVWIVKDRASGADKGVIYVTYDKISEAANAMEEMNGRTIPGNPKPLKVLLANNKWEGSIRDHKEDEKLLRLFIMIPKSYEEDDVRKEFKQYGDIDYVRIIRDRNSGMNKGLAYVKYMRSYHAALALENCDPKYKAIFASVKREQDHTRSREERFKEYGSRGNYECNEYGDSHRPSSSRHSSYSGYPAASASSSTGAGGYTGGYAEASQDLTPSEMIRYGRNDNQYDLEVMATPELSQEQLYRLFDLIPGLEYCNYDARTGMASVRYTSSQCAAYARDKMDGFEYPPGYRIAVRYAVSGYGSSPDASNMEINKTIEELSQTAQSIKTGHPQANLSNLLDSIKKATNVLQSAGVAGGSGPSGSKSESGMARVRYCNIPLPHTQPFSPRESRVAERLFIVSQPDAFPDHILQDCLCRFGNLIDAYFMGGKNYGYAKYTDSNSAQQAIKTLHGQQVCGMRMKVMQADPPRYEDDGAKRPRT